MLVFWFHALLISNKDLNKTSEDGANVYLKSEGWRAREKLALQCELEPNKREEKLKAEIKVHLGIGRYRVGYCEEA